MQSFRSTRTFVLVSLVLVFALGLSACGLDEYAEATNTALANYNSASQAATEQLQMLNGNNAIIGDPDWQAQTSSALDDLEAAGKAFASLPETPSGYEQVDSLVTELAFATTDFVGTARDMIDTQDINQVDALNENLATMNDLVTQIDAAITAANE